ncbi:MAG: ATP-binding cassette domain-containing protein [Verrucomicrobiota bacterium]
MIEVKNLTKQFGPKTAVDDISFSVKKGEVLGFLGPNGAGKSTTMRMITGFIPPTVGEIKIDGLDALESPRQAKAKIGYLPENAPLYSDMAVTDFLAFCGEIRGIKGKELEEAVEKAIGMCFLEKVRNQNVDTLSKGFKHRTCLAQSILHDPDILILDEPTDGLDPNQKAEARALIRRMGEEKAIIFSTHILEEVDAVCSRAIIIDQGKVVADGTPEELRSKAEGAGDYKVTVHGASGSDIRSALEGLANVDSVIEIQSGGTSFKGIVRPKGSASAAEGIFGLCKDRGWSLEELGLEEGRLDLMFRQITMSETENKAA